MNRVLFQFRRVSVGLLIAILAIGTLLGGSQLVNAQDAPPTALMATPPASPITCPSDKWAQAQIGQNVVFLGSEACTWTWRSAPNDVALTCPVNFTCTVDEKGDDPVVVQNGNGQQLQGDGGTFRFKPAFAADDAVWSICDLYHKEVDFGKWADYPADTRPRDPSFDVYYRPVLPNDPKDCGDGTKLAKALSTGSSSDASGTATPATSPTPDGSSSADNTLDPATVAKWCTPDCSAYVSQLVESDGSTNPAGVKLDGKGACFSIDFPDGVTYDLFVKVAGSNDPGTSPTGQGKAHYDNVCVASIRKVPARTA